MSTGWIVLIVVLVILVALIIGLYFLGKRAEKKQEEQNAQVEATAQNVTMLIIDKKADVQTLRNLGADNRTIARIFLFEGRMISAIGAIVGILLGLLLCWLQQQFGLVSMGESSGTFVVDAYPVSVHYGDVLIVLVTVLVVGWVAAWYPVRKNFTS